MVSSRPVERPLTVVHVAPEVAPFSSTGGLGLVAGTLPDAIAALGPRVVVISPMYAAVDASRVGEPLLRIRLRVGPRHMAVTVRRGLSEGPAEVLMLEAPEVFGRSRLYGEPDDALRFAYFCRAALATIRALRLHPDVVHCHDWPAALVPWIVRHEMGGWLRTILTIHNLGYQGTFDAAELSTVGLPRAAFNPHGVEFFGQLSFLKAGLVSADRLTTVSPTYAREILEPEHGHGLDGVLRSGAPPVGVLNGIDVPAAPPREACRRAVGEAFGLDGTDGFVLGMVGRLVWQKGMDLLARAVEPRLSSLRLVALGSGDPQIEASLRALQVRYPGRVGCRFDYDTELATAVLAGSDAVAMPSRYEPCGLTQLQALRYGTLPIVRATGGLADTVRDGATGFVFRAADAEALGAAIDRALATWQSGAPWVRMQEAARAEDFSWARSARRYLELYEEVVRDA